MKEQTIDIAGKTWQFLGHNGETETDSLIKSLKQQRDVVWMALGWLAREDKIIFSQRGGKAYVALTGEESAAFSRMRHSIPAVSPGAKTATKKTVRKTARKKTTRKTGKKG